MKALDDLIIDCKVEDKNNACNNEHKEVLEKEDEDGNEIWDNKLILYKEMSKEDSLHIEDVEALSGKIESLKCQNILNLERLKEFLQREEE